MVSKGQTDQKLKRFFGYMAINCIYGFCVYKGVMLGHQNYFNVVYFITVVLFIISLAALLGQGYDEKLKYRHIPSMPVPAWVDFTYDTAIIVILAYHGQFLLASLYLGHVGCMGAFRHGVKEAQRGRANEEA